MSVLGGVIEGRRSISTRSEEATPRWFSDRCECPLQARVGEHAATTIDASVSCVQSVSLSQDRFGSTGIRSPSPFVRAGARQVGCLSLRRSTVVGSFLRVSIPSACTDAVAYASGRVFQMAVSGCLRSVSSSLRGGPLAWWLSHTQFR